MVRIGMPATTLSRRVPWSAVCDALHMENIGGALPARTQCPCCSGSLVIYNDIVLGGEWHHCEQCGRSGDTIQMVAAAQGTDVEAAALYLVKANLLSATLDEIQYYVREHVENRAYTQRIWDKARQCFLKPPVEIASLAFRLGLQTTSPSSARVAEVLSTIVGGTTHREFLAHIVPAMRNGRYTQIKQLSKGKLFFGRHWGPILIVPYHDMPGRICSFSAIGRGCSRPADEVFKVIRYKAVADSRNKETGLAGMGSLDVCDDPSTVFAVDDWLLMLRLQARACHDYTSALPMVTWYDGEKGRTAQAWDMLGGHNVIFWGPTIDHRLIRQAIRTNGKISWFGPDMARSDSMRSYVKDTPIPVIRRRLLQNAKPWMEVLSNWSKTVTKQEFRSMLLRLDSLGEDITYIEQGCRAAGSTKSIMPAIRREIPNGNGKLVEFNDSWIAVKKNGQQKVVCQAIFHCLTIFKDGDHWWHSGYIKANGKTFPFVDKIHTIQDRTGMWLRNTLLDHGELITTSFGHAKKRWYEVSLEFSQPRRVETTVAAERRRLGL